MFRIAKASMLILGLCLASASADRASAASEQTKVELQIALMDFVDARTVDGRFGFFDRKTSSLTTVFPANLHPKIIPHEDFYILCADFRDVAGKKHQFDFIARIVDGEARIFQMVVDSRPSLIKMIRR